ncbi:MAG: translation initiation factor [Porphyromonas sp.]|nr:translation initiation factor [Porphyromonas sp.]
MAKRKWGGMVFSTNPDYQAEIERPEYDDQPTLPEADQPLRIQRDTKQRKGKVVTLVTGFVGSEEDLKALGKRLKGACGVGGSAKGGEIIVQGDLVDRVHELLLEWGYRGSRKRGSGN